MAPQLCGPTAARPRWFRVRRPRSCAAFSPPWFRKGFRNGFEWRGGLVSNGAGAWFRMGGGAGFEWGAGLVSNGNCGGQVLNGSGWIWFRMETAGAWFRMVETTVSKVSGLLLNIVSEWRRCQYAVPFGGVEQWEFPYQIYIRPNNICLERFVFI